MSWKFEIQDGVQNDGERILLKFETTCNRHELILAFTIIPLEQSVATKATTEHNFPKQLNGTISVVDSQFPLLRFSEKTKENLTNFRERGKEKERSKDDAPVGDHETKEENAQVQESSNDSFCYH